MTRSADAIRRDLHRCAKDIQKLPAWRVQLWREAVDAGISATEIGEIFSLEAQSVRWGLKQKHVPDLSKANHRSARAS